MLEEYWSRNSQRMQAVLRDRFGLVVRPEKRELPVYLLAQAKHGAALSVHPPADLRPPSISTDNGDRIKASNATMQMLASQISMALGSPVQDKTGLGGRYDFNLNWSPDPAPSSQPFSTEKP